MARRPDDPGAQPPSVRDRQVLEAEVYAVRARGVPTATGRFGAMMRVELINDGPVTLILESLSPAATKN